MTGEGRGIVREVVEGDVTESGVGMVVKAVVAGVALGASSS